MFDFIEESFNDYPGKISSVVFFPGCNYRCPACHSKHIVDGKNREIEKNFFKYLDLRKGWIEGVVICGGEPTLRHSLPYLLQEIKKRNLFIKLDTNGNNPAELEKLLETGLIDYVAMDVKGPFYLYKNLTGMEFIDERDDLKKGMNVVTKFPDYEFRTTVVPVLRENKEKSFLTCKEIEDTAKMICDYTGSNEHKYFLQTFVPREGELINSELERFPETPILLLQEMQKAARKYLPRCEIR